LSGVLFDTSVYISALRQGDRAVLGLRRALRTGDRQTHPLWLSIVVLEELYAGAVGAKAYRDLQRMEREFDKIGRLLLPGRRDWTSAGRVLNKIGQKYGFNLVSKARLTNDAVIAMSVASQDFTVQTKNPADFQLIAEFRPFKWETV
jgi:predicted nucleic acid-binding protein